MVLFEADAVLETNNTEPEASGTLALEARSQITPAWPPRRRPRRRRSGGGADEDMASESLALSFVETNSTHNAAVHAPGTGARLFHSNGPHHAAVHGPGEGSADSEASLSDPSLLRLGDGVGAASYDESPAEDRTVNHDLRSRMELQDRATLGVLLAAFGLALLTSCLSIYQVAEDPSPVSFYTDPKLFRQRQVCASADMNAFLEAFNTQPENARLRIVGRNPAAQGGSRGQRLLESIRASAFPSRREHRQGALGSRPAGHAPWDPVLFDVALDLTPFISGEGRFRSQADAVALAEHLVTRNPLQLVHLCKKVEWEGWEDIATNIRQHLRTLGFQGEVKIYFEAEEDFLIYRNHPWQNFLRSRITQALMVLSVFGSLVWLPYLWFRMRTVKVETQFRISVNETRYWEHLAEGLNASVGFQA